MERVTGQPRFRALLSGASAAAALLLAAVGLYGLISYTVAQRAPEMAVRLALGATPGQVERLVVGQGLALAGAGVLLGVAGALAGVILVVAATASIVHARRAMRVNPMAALRAE